MQDAMVRVHQKGWVRMMQKLVLTGVITMVAACFAGCSGTDEGIVGPVEVDIPFITDDEGGVLIFHGVNLGSAKALPLHEPDITQWDAEHMALDWGFNMVRFLIFWDGVEPEPGVYDTDYFDRIEKYLDWFAAWDISIMLDMHQDVYAAKFCCDGAPDWAIRDDGLPFTLQGQWFLNYFEPAVQRAFDNFWNYEGEHSDLQDHYADMWAEVARRFKDHPAVVGYDIMNEPHPGSASDPFEMLGTENPDGPSPGFDQEKLGPFYQRVINRIRQVDPNGWIFYEARYGAPGNGLPSYLPVLDDPREGVPRIVYAPHLYSVSLEAAQAYNPETDKTIVNWEKHRKAEAAAQGCTMVLGEWGLDPEWPNALQFMAEVLAMADRLMAGWTYWAYEPGGWSFLNPDRTERESVNQVVRVYPRRIAGVPVSFGYDPDTRFFRLEFTDHPDITGPTRIYVPETRFYPDGFEVEVVGEDDTWSQQWDDGREILTITTIKTGGTHVVEIRAKNQ